MKTILSFEEWKLFEEVLMRMRAGYKVNFDDHSGTAEMLINIDTISVYRFEDKNEPAPAADNEGEPI
jgi:hypothetical protein